jgi:hypothetical protein
MQATVHRFNDDGSGSVLLDDGVELPFDAAAWQSALSPVRLFRPGQRVQITTGDDGRRVTRLTVVTLPL